MSVSTRRCIAGFSALGRLRESDRRNTWPHSSPNNSKRRTASMATREKHDQGHEGRERQPFHQSSPTHNKTLSGLRTVRTVLAVTASRVLGAGEHRGRICASVPPLTAGFLEYFRVVVGRGVVLPSRSETIGLHHGTAIYEVRERQPSCTRQPFPPFQTFLPLLPFLPLQPFPPLRQRRPCVEDDLPRSIMLSPADGDVFASALGELPVRAFLPVHRPTGRI